ncbi:SRPBCC family protein [Demequina sp. NBRC 110051]|uniref:SRPBCC family protein n=1 Tax=Demequina sp. NBRC 110051 TaxID=1570340 RepID=UPI000A0756FF|nr:SRPBCC family protein [Demequina sp. NBRC 110051]
MTTATSTVDVNVPISTAYNQWTQLESFPHFMQGVEQVTQVGDRLTHWVTKIAGVEREFDAEIIEQVPDSHLAWQATAGLKQGGRVTFEPVGREVTRVSLALDWEPLGATEKIGSALSVDDGLVRTDLEQFKEFIEERGAAEGGWRGEVHA